MQRATIAQALVGRPRVLLLDEPTVGLDPEQRLAFGALVRELTGMAVLSSTHLTDDVAATCQQVVVMREGALIFHGTVEDLQDRGHDAPAQEGTSALETGYLVAAVTVTTLTTLTTAASSPADGLLVARNALLWAGLALSSGALVGRSLIWPLPLASVFFFEWSTDPSAPLVGTTRPRHPTAPPYPSGPVRGPVPEAPPTHRDLQSRVREQAPSRSVTRYGECSYRNVRTYALVG